MRAVLIYNRVEYTLTTEHPEATPEQPVLLRDGRVTDCVVMYIPDRETAAVP